jgi:hypothetical protein
MTFLQKPKAVENAAAIILRDASIRYMMVNI